METVLYREEGLALTEKDGELFLRVGASKRSSFRAVDPPRGLAPSLRELARSA